MASSWARQAVAAALILLAGSCGGGNGGGDGGVVRPPTFVADRTDPAPNDIYLAALSIDQHDIVLGVYCNYQEPGPAFRSELQLNMPIVALEPISATVGDGWPIFSYTSPRVDLRLELRESDAWFLTSGSYSRFDACTFCPQHFDTGVIQLATVTIRVKQSGTFRIELGPSRWNGNNTLSWCDGCELDSRTIEKTPPTFGGTVTVP